MSSSKEITVKKTLLKDEGACKCKKPQLLIEFNFPLEKKYINYFLENNFLQSKSYENIGICYLEDTGLVAMGPFGSNRFDIKCKNSNCNDSLDKIENILKSIKI